MRLLVCVDTGDLSRTIIPQAAALAAACDAEVHLLHVVDPRSARATGRHIPGWDIRASMDPNGGGIEVAPGVGPAQRRDAVYDRQVIEGGPAALQRVEDQTADALDVLAAGFPVEINKVVLADSDAATAIVSYAAEQAIDIIVMATHSRRSVARVLRGSTTTAVIGARVAPVLVVPPDEA
jgi:nucleotide-binding universal stress UspA family protein